MSLSAPAGRRLEPEWLDHLPAADPRARRSRRDLKLVNFLMGHRAILRRAMQDAMGVQAPGRMVELGAGDGTLVRSLAADLGRSWPGMAVQLIDQQDLVSQETRDELARRGWRVECVTADLLEWARDHRGRQADIVFANLVLHHFDDHGLRKLFSMLAETADRIIAVEPRRSSLALAGGRALFLLGCNDVTRHDAVVSVRAGFAGTELSDLWPDKKVWRLTEKKAGLFSHLFVAQRFTGASDKP